MKKEHIQRVITDWIAKESATGKNIYIPMDSIPSLVDELHYQSNTQLSKCCLKKGTMDSYEGLLCSGCGNHFEAV